jgi:uncharacterized hydrophobic protein (TIGR00271 family)
MIPRRRSLRTLARWRRRIKKVWFSNSGEWRWLTEKPVTIAALNRLLWRESVPSLSFFVMLSLSGVISTLGLLAGSTATVIGAMIIAPLMGPIIGMAYALAIANRRLFKRATLTMAAGVLATVLSAMLICRLIGLRTLNSEIMVRTAPTLIDLGVAIAAGAAGAFAKSRRHVADAFPGVAIAVALVPPLSVIGIGLALALQSVWSGALLLFVTNLTGIIVSGILVFLWQRYGSLQRAQSGLAVSFIILAVLGIPLGISLSNLLLQSNMRQQVERLVRDRTSIFEKADIQTLSVRRQNGELLVEMDVAASPDLINAGQIDAVREMLHRELDRPVTLQVRLTPIRQFEAPAPTATSPNRTR